VAFYTIRPTHFTSRRNRGVFLASGGVSWVGDRWDSVLLLRLFKIPTDCQADDSIQHVLCSSWDGRLSGHNRHGPKKLGGRLCPPFGEGELGPHITQCRLGRLPPYQVAPWSIEPLGHNRYGPKIGGCAPFGKGDLCPHLTHVARGRGVSACQVSFWSVQPFGHNTPTSQTGQTGRQTGRTGNDLIA